MLESTNDYRPKAGWTRVLVAVVVLFALTVPARAADLARSVEDISVLLIPRLASGGPDTVPNSGSLPMAIASLNRSLNPTFALEVWLSDLGDINTGIVAAYFDVSWDNVASAIIGPPLQHGGIFTALAGGVVNNPAGTVTNFGGADGTLSPNGISPAYVRLGYLPMVAQADGIVDFGAAIGSLDIGTIGRIHGPVQITPASITIYPEPAVAGLLLVAVFLVRRPRRVHR